MRSTAQKAPGTVEQAGGREQPWLFKVDQAWRTLEATRTAIDRADSKAAVVLGSSGVTAAAIFSLVGTHRPLRIGATIVIAVCAICVLISAMCAGLVLLPRRERSSRPTSLIYFDHVARMPDATPDAYIARATALFGKPEELFDVIANQIWEVSRIAAAKYSWVHRAMISLFGSLFLLGTGALVIMM